MFDLIPRPSRVGKVTTIIGPYLPEPGTNTVIVRWLRPKRGVKGAKETTEAGPYLDDFKKTYDETRRRAAEYSKLMVRLKKL